MSALEITGNPDIAANEFVIARNAAETLHKHYPGHLWAVNVTQGVLDVRNLRLSGHWGFRIKLGDAYSSSHLDELVKMAGGEILERYRLRRGKLNEDHVSALDHTFTGAPKFDHAEAKSDVPDIYKG